jgi:nucleotide-binding universal stress UspA family protein
MKKVLLAVDGSKGSKSVLSVYRTSVQTPEEVILVHVEQLQGKSRMIEMLGEAEMSTLKESLKGTEHKEALDRRAEKILAYYRNEIEDGGSIKIKTVVREGKASEEILKVAQEEGVELIVMGCNGKKGLHRFITGCTTRDVEKNSRVPVLVAKTCGCDKALAWREAYAAE